MDETGNDALKWYVGKPVLRPGPKGSFDDVAVKDPSIVHYADEWHVFYTTKGERTRAGYPCTHDSVGYVHAQSIEGLNNAPRVELVQEGRSIVAPQLFYFTPHQCWYLIAQVELAGKCAFHATYMTNPDISDPEGWSRPEVFTYQRRLSTFWIDFWVICDDTHAHFFYTDHDGRLYRQEAPLGGFPFGFGIEEVAAEIRGVDGKGPWRMHEASHVYKVQGQQKYVALLEAVRPHPRDPSYWDSRSRFMFAMEAESLRGPWRRVEAREDAFWGDPDLLLDAETGKPLSYGQVSHPEAIRSGYDEKLEIPGENPQLLFQAFDPASFDDNFRYDFLPWELALARRQPQTKSRASGVKGFSRKNQKATVTAE